MKKILLVFALLLSATVIFPQTVTLTFTGRDANNHYRQLDRVVIANVTRGWQETIYYPDTVFTVGITGIADNAANGGFGLKQNTPNPFTGTTNVNLTVAAAGEVFLEMTDVNGRIVEAQNLASLQPGNHQFRVDVATAGIYFLTARQNGRTSSIKMVNNGQGTMNRIEYRNFADIRNDNDNVETQNLASLLKGNAKGASTQPFFLGDQMEYVGFVVINGTEVESQRIQQVQQDVSQAFSLSFDFADSRPCPGAATVTDVDDNTYNTVLIGNQCWMKENLRTTMYADGTSIPLGISTSTSTAYRYCPDDNSSNVSTYGYLYNWPAVMGNFTSSEANPSGVQGICPTGWHVPSDAEWTQLTDYVSSQSQYVCGSNNANIAKALASTTGWNSDNSTCAVGNNSSANNATGFSAVPAGDCLGYYVNFGVKAYFWSATQYVSSYAYYRGLYSGNANVVRYDGNESRGFSVRCLRD